MWIVRSLTLGILFFSAACAPKADRGSISDPAKVHEERTGFEEEQGEEHTAYTIAGHPEVYKKMADSFKGKDPKMARSIRKVSVSQKDSDQLEVAVQMNGTYFGLKQVVFEGNKPRWQRNTEMLAAQKDPGNFTSAFLLKLKCLSRECNFIQMAMLERDRSRTLAEAQWLYEEAKAPVKFEEARSGGLVEFSSKDSKSLDSRRTSVVVANGRSYSEFQVSEKSDTQSIEPLFTVETDLVDTQAQPTFVRSSKVRNRSDSVTTVLQGNNPRTAAVMFDVQSEDDSKSTRVYFGDTSGGNKRRLQNISLQVGPEIIRSRDLSPSIDAYAEALDRYSNEPEVIKRIDLWRAKGKACSSCRMLSAETAGRFLTNLQLVRSEIMEASTLTDVSPEKAYILAIESRFLLSNDFPVQVAGGSNTSAAGPWQLQTGTANDMVIEGQFPFQVYDLLPGKKLHASDARNYFYESTLLAFQYFSVFPEALDHDPGLQLAGYYQGPYGMRKIVKRHGGFQTSFAQLVRLGAIPRSLDTSDYVYSVIALRFLGQDPEKFGLKIPERAEPPATLVSKLRMF